MYGLGGAMVSGKPTWGNIHGSVVLIRLEPDLRLSPNAVHNPNLTVDEIYNTLVFFRDAEASAHKIALTRDSARFMKSPEFRGPPAASSGYVPSYLGPAGMRTDTQMKDDADQCAKCGKAQSMVGRLKACTVCKKTFYCNKECQRSDWKRHKRVCH